MCYDWCYTLPCPSYNTDCPIIEYTVCKIEIFFNRRRIMWAPKGPVARGSRSIFPQKMLKSWFFEIPFLVLWEENMSKMFLLSYSEEATKVMVELLRTYSDENASEVKDDARNCVVSLLGRPNVLIMDFLLALPPVAALQGEPIYQVHVHRVRTGHGKTGKSWNLKISRKPCSFKFHFPGLGSYGI